MPGPCAPLSDPGLAKVRTLARHRAYVPARLVRQLLVRYDLELRDLRARVTTLRTLEEAASLGEQPPLTPQETEHFTTLALRELGSADTVTTMAGGGAGSPAEGQRR